MSKRVLVVTSSPPLVEGGHLVIARELVRACREAGHQADLIVTPQNRFGRQGAAYLAAWLTDVGVAADGERVDQVISLRYPGFAVRHPHHTCWLNHTMREYYDLWPQFSASLSWKNRLKESARRALVQAADRRCFARMTARYAISATVTSRLTPYGISTTPLLPPAPVRQYRCDDFGDYVFAVSRLTPLKRFDLLLDALARPEAQHLKAVIAGDGEARAGLMAQARRLDLVGRVTFTGRLTEAELLGHYARCGVVAFMPFDEDYGFVTVEAFAAGKPVVTCADSGGPTELVEDGVSGRVVPASADAVAGALVGVMGDRRTAEAMGAAGRARAHTLSWSATVDRLLA